MFRTLTAFCLSVVLAACTGTGSPVVSGDAGADSKDAASIPDLQVDIASPEVVDLGVEPDEYLFETLQEVAADTIGPQCAPGEGCFLDPCDENGDCQSGWCVQHLGEGVCSQNCQDECPPGWSCQQVAGTVPDVVYICVSDYANLCRPCASSADCTSTGGAEDACLDYGTDGDFCGGLCDQDSDCPWGFSCLTTVTVDGASTLQCVADAGICPCTSKSIELALSTLCEVTNEFGTCTGQRVCTDDGLSQCDALLPQAESCNGIDDDCDGEIDEPDLVDGKYLELCNDDNGCTNDTCSGVEGCLNEILDSGSCDDQDPCTVADHCVAGSCTGDSVECDDENPCTENLCTVVGGCEYPAAPGECDDGEVCTLGDHCVDGECVGEAVACDCQTDEDCADLEDGDLCNGTLVCDTSAVPHLCVVEAGTEVTCPDPEGPHPTCLAAICDPATGACSEIADGEGLACDDSNACTVNETCSDGECGSGSEVNCNDGNPCTDDSCDLDSGCAHLPNTAPCNDGDVCTTADQCDSGACLGGPSLICDDGDVCNGTESCDSDVGCLAGQSLLCDDGDICNGIESCLAETGCKAGQSLQCDDGNLCTDDSCDSDVGCQHTTNLSPCDDGNACTVGDGCKNGICAPGNAFSCNDEDLCTDDACDPGSGCIHLLNSAPCDDGDLCTTTDQCSLGQCTGSGNLVCDDGNLYTDDKCNPDSGCQFVPNVAPCDDGNVCTDGDKCSQGWCAAGSLVSCGDDNPCTTDFCDPSDGCQHAFNIAPCDDANACTAGDACLNGQCQPGEELSCGDDNLCTDDSCNPDSGCLFTPNSESCDDGNACTVGDVCAAAQCQSGPDALDCDDSKVCTDDSCSAEAGCLHTNLENGTSCEPDGKCNDGVCVPDVVDSCKTVLANNAGAASGSHTLDPDGNGGVNPFQVYCEMDVDEGGWTMVMSANTADGHISSLTDTIWTVKSESGDFANRWSQDYKSLAAQNVTGTQLLLILRNHNAQEGADPVGWRSWNLDGAKKFQDFFDVGMGAYNANSSGGCNSGYGGGGHKQTTGIHSSGKQAPYDTFTGWAQNVYTNSYYGNCETTGDGFRLSSWYRWGNNSNVGLGLQMDSVGSDFSLEAGSHLKIDTYGNPQRFCYDGCGSCTAYLDGSYSYTHTKVAIGTDYKSNQCTVGVSYRYEWYVR
jgi:hypothetical protein